MTYMRRLYKPSIVELFLILATTYFLVKLCSTATAGDVSRLHDNLFKNYKKNVRPVENQSDAVLVNISFFIIMIHDLDLRNQVLTSNAWLRVIWKDEFLRWDQEKYGNLTEILVSRKEVWTPDLLVENTAYGYTELGIDEMLINLDHDGELTWEPGVVMQTICEISIAMYPFDSQHCAIRVMSWMHTNRSMKVMVDKHTVDTSGYYPNGEWDLIESKVDPYSPDDGSYNHGEVLPGVEIVLELQRRPMFYIISTLLPISMLSLLNLMVFLLPSNTGEKMTLAVTVLLSFTVFMSVVNEIMPRTSNSVSVLAVYLTILLCMSGLSVASTVLVLYLHHKEGIYRFRWSQHLPELHDSRYYRVRGPTQSNNNKKRMHTCKNGVNPSLNQSLLKNKNKDSEIDAESTPNFDYEDSQNGCNCCFSLKKSWLNRMNRQCSKKVDTLLFWIVTILTCLTTAIVLFILCHQ